jgi:hypothetical protein
MADIPSVPVSSVAGKTGAVTLAKGDVGLGNVGNFKAVSTEASQGLSDTEKSNARANIGAGTSSFSGSWNDLSDKPSSLPANGGNSSTVNGHTVATDVPSGAVFTDTTYGLSINGSTNGDSNGTSLGTIYAPTTAGTSGYVLTSNGSGAPTWAAASGGGNIDYTTTTSNIQNIDATIISTALRKTAQTLTAAEKTQVKTNLGITISTAEPTSSDGEDGDIWLVYDA